MITYKKINKKSGQLLVLTSLKQLEFETLLIFFQLAWNDYITINHRNKSGRKPRLFSIEDKLLFILYYFKTYPLQAVIAMQFGMSQSQANEWIHKLSRVLYMAPDKLGQAPERDAEALEKALQNIPYYEETAIDGTERRCQRPKDAVKQKKYYSGKKKPIP